MSPAFLFKKSISIHESHKKWIRSKKSLSLVDVACQARAESYGIQNSNAFQQDLIHSYEIRPL
jgi:hypothetical protein